MTRRQRLLDWIRTGDPGKMPLLFWVSSEMASAWFGEHREYSFEERLRAARELGAEDWYCVHGPGIAGGVDYCDELSLSTREERRSDGATITTRCYTTPAGTLSEVREKRPGQPSGILRNFVADADAVPAFESLIRTSARAFLDNRQQVLDDLVRETRANIEATADEGPAMMWIFIPMVEITCSQFFRQEEGIYFIFEHRALLEEMMELHMQATMLWIEAGVKAGVDIFGYSINGYEIYSPTLYREMLVPQARKINERIRSEGKLSWWHCCGRFRQIVDDGLWDQINPDVMESYSPPPAGDVTDLRRTRRATDVLASRGAMYVDYLWSRSPDEIKRFTRDIIEAMRGKRHMLGGTDELLPGTPRASLVAMRDAIAEAGMAFN